MAFLGPYILIKSYFYNCRERKGDLRPIHQCNQCLIMYFGETPTQLRNCRHIKCTKTWKDTFLICIHGSRYLSLSKHYMQGCIIHSLMYKLLFLGTHKKSITQFKFSKQWLHAISALDCIKIYVAILFYYNCHTEWYYFPNRYVV